MAENFIFQAWTWAGVVVGSTGTAIAVLNSNFLPKAQEARSALTKIRSLLSHIFQVTVADEALGVIKRVDEYLPTALSRVGSGNAPTNAFDLLCVQLSRLDFAEPNRELFNEILKNSLSGLILKEAEKLIECGKRESAIAYSAEQRLAAQSMRFDRITELRFAFIAEKAAICKNREWIFRVARKCAFWSVISMTVLTAPIVVSVFFDVTWAMILGRICSIMWGGFIGLFLCANVLLVTCHKWLTEIGDLQDVSTTWKDDFGKIC